jgi:hypothetical protein
MALGPDPMHHTVDREVRRGTWDTATKETASAVFMDERPTTVHIWQVVSVLAAGLDDVVSRQLRCDEPTSTTYQYLCALRELAVEVRDYLRDNGEQADFEKRRCDFT